MSEKMTEESYIIVYTILLSQKLIEKWVGKMTEESYIIVYTMNYSQKLIEKWVKKWLKSNI